MKRLRGALVLVRCGLAFMLLFSLGGSQSASAQESCTRRTIAVSVVDKNGEPVPGLTAADFRAEFRSKPVQILSVAKYAGPLRIVVVLDSSGSMQRTWGVVLEAARHIYSTAPPDASLGLILFNDTVTHRIDFEHPRSRVLNALREAERQKEIVKGRTSMLDALAAALDMISQPRSGDLIYVVTDAEESGSRTKLGALEERLLTGGVRLFAFVLSEPYTSRSRAPEQMSGPAELSELIESSGGTILSVLGRPKNISQYFTKFYQRMTEPYELAVELPVEVDKKRDWKLELVRSKELKRPKLAYPRKLVPCSMPATQPAAP